MKLIKDTINRIDKFIQKRPLLKRLHPLIEASDEFFFGTDKTTLASPHILDSIDIKRYMSLVIVALIPASLGGIYFFGLRVLAMIIVSYVAGGVIEVWFAVARRKPIYEGFLVTGLIFPLILPPTLPLWMVAVGVIFGVFFAKEVFGGTGRNIFNPALVGRVFLSTAFPDYFTSRWQEPFWGGLGGFFHYGGDSLTTATPLMKLKGGEAWGDIIGSLLLGPTAGSVGEVFRIGIIAGGLLLVFTKIIDYRIPLAYFGSLALFSFIGSSFSSQILPPLLQLLSGGLLLGGFFMATDPVTSPFTLEGRWIAGVLLGIITVVIRTFSGFPEGVMYAILLVNGLTPLIDNIVVNLKFRPKNRKQDG